MNRYDLSALPSVSAPLNYLREDCTTLVNYMCEPPPNTPRMSAQFDPVETLIRDIRPARERISFDREGFTLLEQRSAVRDFYDLDELAAVYYPEMERFIQRQTGAAQVTVFDHTLRNAVMAANHKEKGADIPVKVVHNDYTPTSGPRRVRELFTQEQADALLQRRFVQVNAWRPIKEPVLDSPLAVCDARTLEVADFSTLEMIYAERTGYIAVIRHSPRHRWFYVPLMHAHEVLLIKGYDSVNDGRSRFTAHSAFTDPTTPADAPHRESIEIRALVFF